MSDEPYPTTNPLPAIEPAWWEDMGGWEHRVRPAHLEHQCPLPHAPEREVARGSRWRCSHCGARWELHTPARPDGLRDPVRIENVVQQRHGADGALWIRLRTRWWERWIR